MANTRKDHAALLRANGIELPHVLVSIPNKIRKRCSEAKKKTKSVSPWALLAMFNPAAYWNLMEQMRCKRRFK